MVGAITIGTGILVYNKVKKHESKLGAGFIMALKEYFDTTCIRKYKYRDYQQADGWSK